MQCRGVARDLGGLTKGNYFVNVPSDIVASRCLDSVCGQEATSSSLIVSPKRHRRSSCFSMFRLCQLGVAFRYSAFRHLLTTRRRRRQVQDLEVLQAWRRGGCGAGCGALVARSLSCRRPDYFVGCELCRRVWPRRLHGARPSRRLLGAATAATFGGGACDGPSRIATRI